MRGFKAPRPVAAPSLRKLDLPAPAHRPQQPDLGKSAKVAQDRARKSPPALPKGIADPPAPKAKSEHADKPISGSQTAAHGKNKTAPVDTPY